MHLETDYLGLHLKNPLVAGGSALTGSLDSLIQLAEAGIGAIILKPIFEEEIIYDIKRNTHEVAPTNNYGESYKFVAEQGREDAFEKYLNLIADAKEKISVPIIGSIDCYSYDNWISYAKRLETAGCDALELNVSIRPYDTSVSADDVERTFSDIVYTIKRVTSLPVAIKMVPYFTDMAKFVQQISWMGIQGISLFNRNPGIDIDLERLAIVDCDSKGLSDDLYNTMCWVSILRNKLRCDISAVASVKTTQDVIKLLLAGAGTVQLTSCLRGQNFDIIAKILGGLEDWMTNKGFDSLADFRGKLSVPSSGNAFMMMRTMQIKDSFSN